MAEQNRCEAMTKPRNLMVFAVRCRNQKAKGDRLCKRHATDLAEYSKMMDRLFKHARGGR